MSGKVKLGVALMTAAISLAIVGATSPGPLMPRAEAGEKAKGGPAKLKAPDRRILRHKEHGLEREERHKMRDVHREKRQVKHIKRELHHHR
jgi:Spy/CpxP family protein refolding chaperone